MELTRRISKKEPNSVKVCILPQANSFSSSVGGVNRVISDLTRLLPQYGIEVVDDPEIADIRHCHALAWHPQVDVYTNHGVWQSPKTSSEAAANEIIYRLLTSAKVVTSVAKHTTEIYKDRLNIQPRIIRNGVDTKRLRSIEQHLSNNPVFLWAKNNMTWPNDPRPVLWLARQLPQYKFILTFAPAGILPPNVTVIGLQPYKKMLQIIADSSVLIATTNEQFSVQVIEALAMGKPILGFNWGGTAEVIQNGYNGYLGNPPGANDTEWPQLLEAANYILQNYDNLSINAKESAKDYDWNKIIPKYIQCYEDALKPENKDNIEVSIVITCYNLEKYIEEAVNSALEQKFDKSYEIIIVDDYSTDDSRKILKRLKRKHKRLHLVFNKYNLKAGPSRNVGIKTAHGTYVLCLDGDDKIPPDYIQKLYQAISSDRSIGIAYGNFHLFGQEYGMVKCQEWNFQNLIQGNFLGCCSMFRKEAWRRCGGYKNINPSWEDYELWLNIGKHFYDGIHVNDTYFNYRIRDVGRNMESQGQEKRLRAIVNACHPELYPCSVGIVIPCYKQKKYLSDAIESLQRQKLQDFRVIIVDDGGHQGLAEIIPNDDHRFRLLELENNQGLSTARNRGIEWLDTEYIVPLDADDMLMPQALEQMLRAQNSTIDPLIVYGDIIPFWDNGAKAKIKLEEYNFDRLLTRSIIPATAMYPREAWEKVGGYDELMRDGYEDWDFHIRLGLIGVCGRKIKYKILKYRQHDGTMRDVLEKDKIKQQLVLDYLHNKHYSIYKGERPMGCCGRETLAIYGKAVHSENTSLVRYTGKKVAPQVIFIGNNRYTFSANERDFAVVNNDVKTLLEVGWFERVI